MIYSVIIGSYEHSIGFLNWGPHQSPSLRHFPCHTNPSWLCYNNGLLFATQEDLDGRTTGQIHCFSFEPAKQRCDLISSCSSEGLFPCHIAIFPERRQLWVSNYMGGPVSCYRYDSGGKLSLQSTIPFSLDTSIDRPNVNLERQEMSHPHSCLIHRNGFYTADLGCDHIRYYSFSNPGEARVTIVPEGFGPRHLCLDVSGQYLFVICELQPFMLSYAIGPKGELNQCSVCRATSSEGVNQFSEICLHPSLPYLYAANRQAALIAQVQYSDNGELQFVAEYPLASANPRHIAISPDGRFIFTALQDSDKIQVLAIEELSGALKPLSDDDHGFTSFPAPSFLGFV